MDKETSVRLDAPEGHMLVNRKLKAISRIVRTRTEWSGDWGVLLEAEAEALDKEWHPEFYGSPPRAVDQTLSQRLRLQVAVALGRTS